MIEQKAREETQAVNDYAIEKSNSNNFKSEALNQEDSLLQMRVDKGAQNKEPQQRSQDPVENSQLLEKPVKSKRNSRLVDDSNKVPKAPVLKDQPKKVPKEIEKTQPVEFKKVDKLQDE